MPNTLLLDEPFQVTGKWWLPDHSDKAVQGILTYSPTEIELTLIGGFADMSADSGVASRDFERITTIYGFADGRKFTLQDAIIQGRTIHSNGGLTETKCSAGFVFVGSHVDKESEFRSIAIGCRHLDGFLNTPAINVRREIVEKKLRGITAECKAPEPKSFQIDAVGSEMEIRSHPNVRQDRNSATLRIESHVLFRFDTPQCFDPCLKTSWRLCQLLTLLTDQFVKPEWLELVPNSSEESLSVLWKVIRQRELNIHRDDVLIHFADCENFQTILNNWFSASETLMNSVYMFLASRTKADAGTDRLEPCFLMASQAFEAFSRATTESTYMDQQIYDQQVAKVLKEAIPTTVGADHRSSLKNRIRYGNELSLRKRLSNSLEELPSELHRHVFKDAKRFTNGVVDTRNFLTHYGDDLREKALDNAPLWWATEKLVMLVRILLLRHVGIKEDRIAQALDNHHFLMQHPLLWGEFEESRSTG